MTEALLFVSVGSLLTVGAATFTVAALTLRKARMYVELAEERMEHLREGQARLMIFLLEERRSLKGELEEERGQRLEAQHEQGQELRTRRDAERRIDDLKREILEQRRGPQGSSSALLERMFEDASGTREQKPPPPQRTRGTGPAPASPPEVPPEDKRPRLAVWHPHPDDDVNPGGGVQEDTRSAAPVEMFRRHYDKYLENYEGYVKLAKRIYQARGNAEAAHGSLGEREWQERLRRVNDGIKRTTARLDILEEYNPELATDDRISRRASIARDHSALQRSR